MQLGGSAGCSLIKYARRKEMKYCELTGWKRIIAEACRINPDLVAKLNQMIEQQAQPQSQRSEPEGEQLQAS